MSCVPSTANKRSLLPCGEAPSGAFLFSGLPDGVARYPLLSVPISPCMDLRPALHLLGFLLFHAASAQEICTNGIDDDSDGLIDLNDTLECACGGALIPGEAALPDPSFEAFDCIPETYGQTECLAGWEELGQTDVDVFHTAGYMPDWVPLPLPGGGSGCVGGYACQDYKEYIRGCTEAVLLAGNSYHMTLSMGTVETDNFLSSSAPTDLSPINITLYGRTTCGNAPWDGSACPIEEGWVELGSALYMPASTWSGIVIDFVPGSDMLEFEVGAPCTMPSDYPFAMEAWLAYFLYDDLELTADQGCGLFIDTSGSFCQAGVLLAAHPTQIGWTYQWYQEGIAVPFAIADTVLLVDPLMDPGEYQVMALGDTGCAFGSAHVSPPAYPEPTILEIANVLYCDIVGTWQWYFSGMLIPGATDQSIVPDANGTYTVEVTLTTGCAGVSEPYPVADVGLGGVTAEVPKMRLSIDDGHLTLIGANDRCTSGCSTCRAGWSSNA